MTWRLTLLLMLCPGASLAAPATLDEAGQRAAARYMDARTDWWLGWKRSARGEGTSCVTCHSSLPFGLARPLLGGASASVKNIERRVARWEAVEPTYGKGQTLASRATEAVLNAVVLTAQRSPSAQRALELMWRYQDAEGAWPWLEFDLAPWEDKGGRYFGATLAAIAAGSSAFAQPSEKLQRLRRYLARGHEAQSLHNKAYLLWASAKLKGLLSEAQKRALILALHAAQKEGGFGLARLGPWTAKQMHPQDAQNDGYATGLVVYALRQAGISKDEPHLKRAIAWLLAHQDAEGSWPATYLNKPRNAGGKIGKFMRDASTAFAILALMGPAP